MAKANVGHTAERLQSAKPKTEDNQVGLKKSKAKREDNLV